MSSKAGDGVLAWRLRSSPRPPSRWAGLPRGLGSQPSQRLRSLWTPAFLHSNLCTMFGAEKQVYRGARDLALCPSSATTSCVNLGMLLGLSEPPFPHL